MTDKAMQNLTTALANDPRTATPEEASAAYMELYSMFSHRGDGIPTQYVHGSTVAHHASTMWKALITALRAEREAAATITDLQSQLAASQAREAKLREGLEVAEAVDHFADPGNMIAGGAEALADLIYEATGCTGHTARLLAQAALAAARPLLFEEAAGIAVDCITLDHDAYSMREAIRQAIRTAGSKTDAVADWPVRSISR